MAGRALPEPGGGAACSLGEGLEFRRTITVDDKYLFTVSDQVANKGDSPVTLYPYALLSRHGTPPTLGYYILFEGMIGMLGDKLQEKSYSDMEKEKEARSAARPDRRSRDI